MNTEIEEEVQVLQPTSLSLVNETRRDKLRAITSAPLEFEHPKLVFKTIHTRKVEMTPARAEAYLGMAQFGRERPLKDSHVNTLTEKLRSGLFIWDDVRIKLCLCKEDGKTYRTNGQHCCWMAFLAPDDVLHASGTPFVTEILREVPDKENLKYSMHRMTEFCLGR